MKKTSSSETDWNAPWHSKTAIRFPTRPWTAPMIRMTPKPRAIGLPRLT
jgi:hypothetical protein